MINKDEFAKFMFALRKVVPTYAPDLDDEETVRLWFQAFLGYEMEDLRRIYSFVRDNEKHFPSIARLKELLKATAASKFDELVYLIGKHGGYVPPTVDEIMARTINRLGGWQRICEWTNEDLPFRRKDFDAIYSELSAQSEMGQLQLGNVPTVLAGLHESTKAKSDSSLVVVSGGKVG